MMEENRVVPPPVPPRNAFPGSSAPFGYPNSYHSTPWSSMGPSYGAGSYYNSPYSSFGSYNSYSNHGNNFIPSGARGPFETVESVVHAVSSISMLLESTYSALLSSVRSVFAVGEQLGRMRSQMGHLYAALAFTRFLRWFREHFGWILGRKPSPDLIWNNVSEDKRPTQWPLLAYMAFLIGAPYLTWRFVKSVSTEDPNVEKEWMKGESEHFVAKANFSFEASRPDELSFRDGDTLRIAPTDLQTSGNRGWLLATVDGEKSGLVPANRVKILGRKSSKSPTSV